MSTGSLKQFSATLEEALTRKRINKSELAEALGVSSSSVTAWVQGKNFPGIPLLGKLSSFLEIPLRDFIEGSYEPNSVSVESSNPQEPSPPYMASTSPSLVIRMGSDLEMTVPVFGPDDRAKAMSDATAMIQKIRAGRPDPTAAAVFAVVADTAAKSSASPKPPAI